MKNVTIGLGAFIHNSNAWARLVSLGLISCFILRIPIVRAAGADEREKYVPRTGIGPGGDVDSYAMMQSLAGQNHLLEQLHAAPRYIQDGEWVELERVLRNSFNLTFESLQSAYPELTKGDIRTYILSHLQFSVSEQAVLLGISPASVTKARQRLKAKLKQ